MRPPGRSRRNTPGRLAKGRGKTSAKRRSKVKKAVKKY